MRLWHSHNRERVAAYKREAWLNRDIEHTREVKRIWRNANKEVIRQQKAASYQRHKESIRERQAEYYRENADSIKSKTNAYRLSHLAEKKARDAAYYLANAEALKAYVRAYSQIHASEIHQKNKARYQAHKDEICAKFLAMKLADPIKTRWLKLQRNLLRIARLRGAQVGDVDFDVIAQRDRMTCGICGKKVVRKDLSFDHIIPLSKGGPHANWNIQVAHRRCNSSRGAGKIPAQIRLAL